MKFYIDIHTHPSIKPYGQSYLVNNENSRYFNSYDQSSKACIWFKDYISKSDKFVENILGVSCYTQSDLYSSKMGGVKVLVASLYPIEKEFFITKQNLPENISKYLGDWFTHVSKARIEDIVSEEFNYWKDLNEEMQFMQLLNDKIPTKGTSKYKIIKSYTEIDEKDTDIVYVVLSIEGAHVFCEGNDTSDPNNFKNIEANIAYMKNSWPQQPFFITLGHHFYNGMCSHAESLPKSLQSLVDQTENMQKPIENGKYINQLGYKTINALLSKNNGPQILVDVKHLCAKGREELYKYYEVAHPSTPIIYSHGGVAGNDTDKQMFFKSELNLNDVDIYHICKSNGLIGLEIDQRIMGYNSSKSTVDRTLIWASEPFKTKRSIQKEWAKILWNNLIYVAEYCYKNIDPKNPWANICIGSDYDGIINPLNEFRSIETLPMLQIALVDLLNDYWAKPNSVIPKNTVGDAQSVIDGIMFHNAFEFMKKNFIGKVKQVIA